MWYTSLRENHFVTINVRLRYNPSIYSMMQPDKL